jgi:ABC-type Fe3+/spermidine/putrescine transport system ATPase subunit
MFQDYALFPHMDVFGNVAFGLRMVGLADHALAERVAAALDLVGLPGFERRDVHTLSGGEQQRVALARSLAPEPRLLMLDEPLGALDRSLRERLILDLGEILRRLRQTALYITHDQEEAFALAHRVVVMQAGRVAQIGAPQAIYRQPATAFVASFLGLTNLFEADVVTRDGLAFAQTPIGDLPIPPEPRPRVTLLLRPDAARLGVAGAYALDGTVVERSFRGSTCRLVVTTHGKRLTFDFLSTEPIPSLGEEVRLAFDPREAVQVLE